MRKVDPTIKLIGWGDSGWEPEMIEKAGEHIDFVAFHHLFDPGAPLSDNAYLKDPAATWDALMGTVKRQERKLVEMRQQVEAKKFPLVMIESHFTMQGRNRCDVNSAWATGVAYARFLNLHQRHGDLLRIANLGDFCGTRWQSNVIMIPTPGGKSYIMPLGKVTALYRKHTGQKFVRVSGGPPELDITASRTGDQFFLHVVNTHRTRRTSHPLRQSLRDRRRSNGGNYFREGRSHDPARARPRRCCAARLPAASVTAVEVLTRAA